MLFVRLLSLAMLFHLSACATFIQFQALSPEERATYIAQADQMTLTQRQEYLAIETPEARAAYLQTLGSPETPAVPVATTQSFTKPENRERASFYKGLSSSTSEDRAKLMSAYDERTQSCISYQDLQRGWNKEQVLLSIGKPIDIFVSEQEGKKKQLWVYNEKSPATYLYFENGQLHNWAK